MKKILEDIYNDNFCQSLVDTLTEEEKEIVSKEVEDIASEIQNIVDFFKTISSDNEKRELFAKSINDILSKEAEFWQQKS
tara:strand:+ start:205 stop:444 length:240 start_codon:yes stop_codon:yes gene_type:complete